jgi:hypothetical protein
MAQHDAAEIVFQEALARLTGDVLDRIWAADERFAARPGWVLRRSRWGWRINVCDPRWCGRRPCPRCTGTGRAAGTQCLRCLGTGVLSGDRAAGGGS